MNRIALGLIVGWFGCWVCAEVQWYEGVKESPAHLHTLAPSRALAASDVARFVHTLVLNNHTQIGSCVSIGPGAYVTARHIFQDANASYLPLQRVNIDDQTVNAQVEHLLPQDLSLIRTDGNLVGAPLAEKPAAINQHVLLYGITTAKVQHGHVVETGLDMVRVDIDAHENGVTQGDSGGGVFTEDGRLLGVISAFYGSRTAGTADVRRVYVAPVSGIAARLSKAKAAVAPAQARPKISIISPATWDCPSCPAHRDQDWSDFDVTFKARDGLRAYPCTEWTDPRGVVRRLYGHYTPAQVRWSWERTR